MYLHTNRFSRAYDGGGGAPYIYAAHVVAFLQETRGGTLCSGGEGLVLDILEGFGFTGAVCICIFMASHSYRTTSDRSF